MSLRGSSTRAALAVDDERRPARSRSTPSGSARDRAPVEVFAGRPRAAEWRNEALALNSALREPIPGSVARKQA